MVAHSAETFELWQMDSFPKDEKHATESIRPKKRLCEFCIITQKGKVGHI